MSWTFATLPVFFLLMFLYIFTFSFKASVTTPLTLVPQSSSVIIITSCATSTSLLVRYPASSSSLSARVCKSFSVCPRNKVDWQTFLEVCYNRILNDFTGLSCQWLLRFLHKSSHSRKLTGPARLNLCRRVNHHVSELNCSLILLDCIRSLTSSRTCVHISITLLYLSFSEIIPLAFLTFQSFLLFQMLLR